MSWAIGLRNSSCPLILKKTEIMLFSYIETQEINFKSKYIHSIDS